MTDTAALARGGGPDPVADARSPKTQRSVSASDQALAEVPTEPPDHLQTGRSLLGVVARFEYGPIREALHASMAGCRTAVLLGLAGGANGLTIVFWPLLGKRIQYALGVGSLNLMPVITLVALFGFAVPVASIRTRISRRQAVALGTGCAATSLLCAGVAGTFWGFVAASVLAGAGIAFAHSTHFELLLDTYRPEVRVRMLSLYTGAFLSSVAAGVGLLAWSVQPATVSWRLILIGLTGCSVVLTATSLLVADTERGHWDLKRIEKAVFAARGGLGTGPTNRSDSNEDASGTEKFRRVLAVRPFRGALVGASLSGMLFVPVPIYSAVLWRDRFNVSSANTGWLLALSFLVAAGSPAWFAKRGEVAFRRSPSRVAPLAAWAATVAAVALSMAGASPSLWFSVAALGIAAGGLGVLLVGSMTLMIPMVDMRYRTQASLIHAAAVLVGAVAGGQLMSAIGARFGVQWAFVIIGLLVVCGVPAISRVGDEIEAELDRVIGQTVDSAELQVAVSRGKRPALLDCRHLNFFYGQLQVLFEVDFSVDEGEMVALLGTNGAGKSTLLRAISGVGFVHRGSLHYNGSEITYLPYDRRVRLGIVQIPGGRAVFGQLTVVDNLRAFGFAHGTNRKAIEEGIEASFATFPRLAERRNQQASTLSGGEQQMLGLAKAVILKPRLLLIDELSLGLAPRIVGELLEMVRQINRSGTAVVLVEQSVNIALSLVNHAYFMEKGEIRFNGSAAALLERPDLLRAVFLQGATKGLT